MKILILSCDKNQDLFYPFYRCLEKYWPDHPEVIYSTESINNQFYKTISFNYSLEHWTDRIRETLSLIDDEYVLVMVDDVFLQDYVDNEKIKSLTQYFNENTACINLEPSFDEKDTHYQNDILKRNPNGKYKISVMCGLWRRTKLINLLNYSTNPWQFEWDNKHQNYTYLITAHGDYLNWGYKKDKQQQQWRFGLHQGKWFKECIEFFHQEDIEMDFSQRGSLNLKKCFGIISYFPWEQPARKQRQRRLERLIKQLNALWPDIPIMIITQQWKDYNLDNKCRNPIIRFDYNKLGILNARHTLRRHFLESDFDYLIMFDDDAIIELEDKSLSMKYMEELDKHPDGFCFIKGKGSSPYTPYNDSQLNLCAISRYIYEREPIPNIDPQKSEAFEDRIWSTLLHFKYSSKEFDAPPGIRCVHFKNPDIDKLGGEVPSTWSAEKPYNWKQMRQNTPKIEEYIMIHKELPKKW